ncbi:MAG TPA: RNA 2',3'-cyclic phosphodiesterase [Vicinamibacterales bacterium]|jgi:2'-5' RNA ligase
MRLFIAVELDDVVRRSAAAVAERLDQEFRRGNARRSVTWVAQQNLHLTLRFLGEVDASRANGVIARLTPPFATSRFDIAVAGVGAFPPSGPPRVIWMGVTDGARALVALHHEVETRLDGLGFEREDRPFRAHLTIGRVKAPLGSRAQGVLSSLPPTEVGRCQVGHVTLFESRLSPKGPTYSAVMTSVLAR